MRLLIIAAAGFLLTPGGAAAQPGDVSVAVLGIEATDAPDTLAAEITDALRRRVAATKGFQLIPGKELIEIKLVFSCPDEAPSCMAAAGESLGASKLLFGGVKKAPAEGYTVALKLLDTNKRTVDAWVNKSIPKYQASGDALRGHAQSWFAELIGLPAAGSLRVRANVVGASIAVDGTLVTATRSPDVVLQGLNVGSRRVRIEKPGFRTFEQDVTVTAGDTVLLSAELQEAGARPATSLGAAPAAESAEEADDPRRSLRSGFWVTLGAALGSTGAAAYFGREVLRVNSDLDPFRRFDCSAGTCNKDKQPAAPLSPAERQKVDDLRGEGRRAETLQWVFIGLGGAFAAASGYLFYRGYLDEPSGSTETSFRGLRVFPSTGAGSGGITAELDF